MATELIERFREKVQSEKVNLTKLSGTLNIPYDRMYKWLQGKGNPKPPDDKVLEDWINGISSNLIPNQKPINMQQDYTERLLKSYEDRIAELKDAIENIRKHNETLQNIVHVSLQSVLKNQVVHEAAMEARQDKILELMAKDEADFDRIFDSVYKSEVQRMKAYDGTDNPRLQIGNLHKKLE